MPSIIFGDRLSAVGETTQLAAGIDDSPFIRGAKDGFVTADELQQVVPYRDLLEPAEKTALDKMQAALAGNAHQARGLYAQLDIGAMVPKARDLARFLDRVPAAAVDTKAETFRNGKVDPAEVLNALGYMDELSAEEAVMLHEMGYLLGVEGLRRGTVEVTSEEQLKALTFVSHIEGDLILQEPLVINAGNAHLLASLRSVSGSIKIVGAPEVEAVLQLPNLENARWATSWWPEFKVDNTAHTFRMPWPTRKPIKGLELGFEATSTRLDELRVTLVAPNGKQINLPQLADPTREGSSTVTRTYTAELAELLGNQPIGEWRVVVSDIAGDDPNYIKNLALKVTT